MVYRLKDYVVFGDETCGDSRSEGENLKTDKVYDWVIYGEVYRGTVRDFAESTYGSHNKYIFNCEICGNEAIRGAGAVMRTGLLCSDCAKSGTLDYKKSLEYCCPEAAEMYADSNKLDSKYVLAMSNKRYNFICREGHSFVRSLDGVVSSIKKGRKVCPVCSGAIVLEGYNDLQTFMPEVVKYWDYDKNEKKPTEVGKGSEKEYWFKCEKGHSYMSTPCAVRRSFRETRTVRCPICKGYKVEAGVNDLATVYPDIVKYWNYELNDILPEEVSKGKGGEFWFKCDKNHSYLSTIEHMKRSVLKGLSGCPVCSGRSLVEGNSLYDVFGDMVDRYWDYDKNDSNGLKPDTIAPHSNIRAFWRCVNCGKTYEQQICNRVVSVGYCPDCVSKMYQSSGEAELADWLGRYVDVVERYKFAGRGTELDIYVPSKKLGIEFNGIYYHSDAVLTDKNSDYKKYKKAEEKGITFMCVWEDDWKYKKDLVKLMILRKLGLSTERKVNARDCRVVKSSGSSGLLDKYHIQGKVNVGCKYYHLVEKSGNVVAELAYKQDGESLYIIRYGSSCIVRGGFSKILSVLKSTEGCKTIYTFSDNSVSDGSMYRMCGFRRVEDLRPDYSYVFRGKRVHKSNFRKDRFLKDERLIYKEGLTEKELAMVNGLNRVYDYGKVRWELAVEKSAEETG